MKKLLLLFISLLVSVVSIAQLSKFLKTQPEIKVIEKIQGNDFFNETYKIMIRQPLDHSDTLKGFFYNGFLLPIKEKKTPYY